MDEEVRKNCLSEDERVRFLQTHGYLVIPDALTEAEVDNLSRSVDLHAERLKDPKYPNVNVANILGLDEAFSSLIDCPRVLPKIWGILGWNIWVNHSHFNVNPPLTWKVKPGGRFPYGWHRDGGSIRRDLKMDPSPMLSIKVGFYLTDVGEEGGATLVVEGSHLDSTMPVDTVRPPQARPIVVKRGTAVIYDNRVLHSFQSPNTSTVTRKAVFITYAYRWLQPIDENDVGHLAGKVSPVRAQLLGLTTTFSAAPGKGRSGKYYPVDEDVPLKQYIATALGPDADNYVARSVYATSTVATY